jgi:DNA polymerase III epsilon subunit
MREVVIDTETTNVKPGTSGRIIEFAAIELLDGEETGEYIHHYINPQIIMSNEVIEIHGITNVFLSEKPSFCELSNQITDFIDNTTIVGHHIEFDLDFIDYEMELCNSSFDKNRYNLVDTLTLAKKKFPGQRNTLYKLIERLSISIDDFTETGVLLDARIVAKIYSELKHYEQ